MTERAKDYWEGYRASLMDLRVALTGWTRTGDVEGVIDLIDCRLAGVSTGDDDIPFSSEPHFRATDRFGGRGANGGFPVATSYTAVVEDGVVYMVKAGLPGDTFEPDQAAGYGELLKRCAARAGLPSEPAEKS